MAHAFSLKVEEARNANGKELSYLNRSAVARKPEGLTQSSMPGWELVSATRLKPQPT